MLAAPAPLRTALTYEGVGHVGPVDAALQLQLVVGLDIEEEMLVEADTCDQVCPVGTFQGAPAVDMLGQEGKAWLTTSSGDRSPSLTLFISRGNELLFLALELAPSPPPSQESYHTLRSPHLGSASLLPQP